MPIKVNFTTVRPDMAHTRTAKDWYTFLGMRAENMGILAKLYPNRTASYFTEQFGNVIYNGSKGSNKYQNLNTLAFSWEVQMNEIVRIPFALDVADTFGSVTGIEIPVVFKRRWYEVNDTFMIDGSHQLCYVVDGPIRKADDMFEYNIRLVDANGGYLDTSACKAGMTTRWIGNIQPELHETGNVKFQSNYESMQGWIQEIRCDLEYSARYLALEDQFVKVSQEKDNGNRSDYLFKMPGRKKLLLDNFMEARNNSLMWQKSTMDENGRCTLQDRQGRDLIAGDGIMAQYMRYASKYSYSKLSMNVMNEAMSTLSQKCDSSTGNTWLFLCNLKAYQDVNKELAAFLANQNTDGAYLYSKFEGQKLKIGAEYAAYTWLGNTILFKLDDALTTEYPDKGFAILVDQSTDTATGTSSWSMFTLRGKSFIDNTLKGVGIESGNVATGVAGGKDIVSGYAGIMVKNPYRAYVMIQN